MKGGGLTVVSAEATGRAGHINTHGLERLFLWALIAAGVAGGITRFGIWSDLFGWLAVAAMAVAALAAGLLILRAGGLHWGRNRFRRQVLSWLAAALAAAVLWSFGEKPVQAALPFLSGARKFWNALNEFGLFFVALFVLIAAAVAWAGTLRGEDGHKGLLEHTFVTNMTSKIAGLPMILTALAVFVGGTVWTVVYSFTNSKLLPRAQFVGFDQYERLWSTNRWIVSIENLLIYGACSLVLSFVIGFVLAALLDQKIRFENTFRTILLYPFALSFIVTGLVWQWLLNPDLGIQAVIRGAGWVGFTFDPLNNADYVIFGVLIAGLWQGTGLIMVLMLAGLRGIDQEIWKAARVDGIPMWKTYVFIVIPMMRPVFITSIVIIASGIVRLYDLVVAQTSGGPGIASQVPAIYVYDYMFQGQNLGQGFAASTMMLLAVAIVIIPWAYLEFGSKKRG